MDGPELRLALGEPGRGLSAIVVEPRSAVTWLALAHGAGAGMEHPFLAGFARRIAGHGVATVRFNFPYMESGRRSPDPERKLRDAWQLAFESAVEKARGRPTLVGGKSLGGRIASMCVADGMPAAGLVFLGYPFHPPGKAERVRDEHLYSIRVPMLFLQGTADPFASPPVVERVLRSIGPLAEYRPIEGGDHSFKVRGRPSEPREIGADLAELAAPFVLRVGAS
jgi:predicted alpha/beta-hydrolase family hydrolase